MLGAVLTVFITLLAILLLSRWVSKLMVGLMGGFAFNIFMLPGVLVHELSHLIGAICTLTPVRGFSVIPENTGDGEWVLGKVTHDATDNPLKQIIISTMPFFGGAVAVWLSAGFLLKEFQMSAPAISLTASGIEHYIWGWFAFANIFFHSIDLSLWQSWVFLYLTITICAHLAPSNHDLLYALGGVVEMIFIVAVIALALSTIGVVVKDYIAPLIMRATGTMLSILTYILAVLILIALVAGILSGLKRLLTNRT